MYQENSLKNSFPEVIVARELLNDLDIHQIMTEHHSYSWTYLNCGLPNLSTDLFEDFSTSFSSSKRNCVLDNYLPPKTSTHIKKFE